MSNQVARARNGRVLWAHFRVAGSVKAWHGESPRILWGGPQIRLLAIVETELAISCDHIGAWPHCHQRGTNQELMEAHAETYRQALGGVWKSSTLFLKNKMKVKIENCQEKILRKIP